MKVGTQVLSPGRKSLAVLAKLFALAIIFVVLTLSGELLGFGLTLSLAPADQGDSPIFSGDFGSNSISAEVAKYAEPLFEAERTHPKMTAEYLADIYDRGVGVTRDPVLAAVFAWRASHGNYFGLCEGQDDCGWAAVHALDSKISMKLSDSDRSVAREVEALRYPNLTRRYRLSYLLDAAIAVTALSIFGAVCWRFFRPLSNSNSPRSDAPHRT